MQADNGKQAKTPPAPIYQQLLDEVDDRTRDAVRAAARKAGRAEADRRDREEPRSRTTGGTGSI